MVWIAEWKTGQVFKPTTTQTAGGPRMLFAAGATGTGGPDGTLNLTPDGQKMFLNAVLYLLGGTPGRYPATAPQPANKATDVPQDVTLGWSPGKYAASHDVYVGLSSADVGNASRTGTLGVLASQGQSDGNYVPAGLLFGQTYYWRVDEVNASPSSSIFQGDVWSFTVEPYAYPIQNVTATASTPKKGWVRKEPSTARGSMPVISMRRKRNRCGSARAPCPTGFSINSTKPISSAQCGCGTPTR